MPILLSFVFSLCYIVIYSQSIQSPDQFLSHQIGDQFTPHHLLVDYYQYVAEQSPQVQLIEYGRTHEQRPLLLAYVSSPENLAKLEAIRQSNLGRAGLAGTKEMDNIAIVWLSFSVHGNEAAGSESSMPVLHQLVTNPTAMGWLENSIVILDPCINPDGYSRYTHWNRRVANRRLNIDGQSIEHQEPWPGGRTNHYYFDLNRDWAWQTQIESQQRMDKYLEWLPHIHVDFHEMGFTSPYYFAPAAQPYHAFLTDWQISFQETIGENHARHFEKNGWLFYTREVFDLLYPGYGDTYPIFHGAIGMTYEQGGGGRASRGILLPTGDTLTLHDRVAHHVTTALSTIEVGSKNAEALIRNFETFYENSKNNTPGKYNAYVLSASHPGKLKSFSELLDKNHIQYAFASDSKRLDGFHLNSGTNKTFQLAAGDLIINLNQPYGLFTQILMEPAPDLVDSLTYDITAWSVALGYGLNAYGLKEVLETTFIKESTYSGSIVRPGAYAYILPWGDKQCSYVLSQLLDQCISVRAASEPFSIENTTYPRGSLLVLRGDNRRNQAKLFEVLKKYESSIRIESIMNSWMDSGPDFGSRKMRLLVQPKVLSLVGDEVSSNAAGQVWHYLEQRLDYPVALVEKSSLSRIDLNNYNVLIIPEGSYRFSDNERETLDKWVRQGGKLIAMSRAIRSLKGWDGYELESVEELEEGDIIDIPYNQRNRHSITDQLPGALIQTDLDETHPLTYGLTQPYFSLKTGSTTYQKMEAGWNAGSLSKDPLTYGFVGSNVKRRLSESLIFGIRSKGRGSIIYLVDNPLFRGFWEEGNILMDNALFIAGN